jgi:hypothetical protein
MDKIVGNRVTLTVVAHKLNSTYSKPTCGYIKPIWVIDDKTGDWYPADEEHFPCRSSKIFVMHGYEIIDKTFEESTLFKVPASLSSNVSDGGAESDQCRFVAFGTNAKRLDDKELIELLPAQLPDPNDPIISSLGNPCTRYIALLDSNGQTIYGIFDHVDTPDALGNVMVCLSVINNPLLKQERQMIHIYKVDLSKLGAVPIHRAILHDKPREFLFKANRVFRDGFAERIPYLSDKDILRIGAEILEETSPNAFKKNTVHLYQKNISSKLPLSRYQAVKPIIDRFFDIVERIDKLGDQKFDWVSKFFNSEQGQKTLSDLFDANPNLLQQYAEKEYQRKQQEIEERIKEKRQQEKELDEKVRSLHQKIGELNRELQIKESEEAKSFTESAETIKEGLDKEIDAKRAEIRQLEETIADLNKRANKSREYTFTEEQIKISQGFLERIKKETEEAKERKIAVERQLQDKESDLKKKLFEMKPYIEALTGFSIDDRTCNRDFKVEVIPITNKEPAKLLLLLDKRDELLSRLIQYFNRQGRTFTREEIANLLICLHQSFITVLAGVPGVGKTSLIKVLSDGLGIKNRLLDISIGRGWTSQRDLIGYFNPLTGRFQPAPTGFYDLLKVVGSEAEADQADVLVLLDEANLSPIEHYWSVFMAMTDDEGRREIRLGNEEFRLPGALRFVATINYDSTTELLSPRMIDRAPILVLEPKLFQNSEGANEEASSIEVYSATIMDQWFGIPDKSQTWSGNEEKILNEIARIGVDRDTKYGRPLLISPRKIKTIARYCSQANPIMRTERELLALDYAVAQHILPMISGHGEAYRHRLEGILATFEKHGLDMSAKRLHQIIETGKQDLDSYNFFIW